MGVTGRARRPPDRLAALEKEHAAKLAVLDARVKQLERDKADSGQIKAARKERDDHARAPLTGDMVYAVAEGKTGGKKKVGNVCVQIKGDPERLGPEVPRRFPSVLGGQTLPAGTTGSGRLHLANWIAGPKKPLTARVMVNRVWQYHFGKGLVRTASNFGTLGQPPTHPELLDWLAAEFAAKDWSVKALHRLVMLLRTYQQAGRDDPANAANAANDFLWRFDRRRLDTESRRVPDPLDDHRQQRALPGHARDPHRVVLRGPAEHRELGQLRARHGEPKPPVVRGDRAAPPLRRDAGVRQRLPPRVPPGHARAARDRAGAERPAAAGPGRLPGTRTRLRRGTEQDAPAGARARRRVGGARPLVRDRVPDAVRGPGRSTCRKRRRPRWTCTA